MAYKTRKTKNYIRKQVKPVTAFDPRSFRVKDVGRKGYTKLVVGCPKGKFKKGRCTVGTQTQSILTKRK